MNQESLSHIAHQKESLNADAVLDLVQMCQTFPYFHVPYVVLSKHYQSKNDFRTENTLFQAALRTPNRAWLFDYITNNNFSKPELDEISTQPTSVDTDSETIYQKEIQDQGITEINVNPVSESEKQEIETSIENNHFLSPENISKESFITNDLKNDTLQVSSENAKNESTPISEITKIAETTNPVEFNKEPILESVTFLEPDRIEPTFDKEPESMLFVPSIEPEVEIETTDLEVEKTNRTWLFDPAIEKIDEIPQPQKLTFAAAYNIEDYFKLEPSDSLPEQNISSHPEGNNDFFSWLNSGLSNQGPKNKPHENTKVSLIDKFIQENPSIQRPKKEFFSPERAMKKSEVLDMNLVTETLANIYTTQGYPEKAIKVYEQLQLKFPEKLSYFASLIEKLKREHNL